ncbi:hypothetical protein HOG98_01505 [bacterium]|jgi:hypothetical protein|nr:hypothetical protein [bacterium]
MFKTVSMGRDKNFSRILATSQLGKTTYEFCENQESSIPFISSIKELVLEGLVEVSGTDKEVRPLVVTTQKLFENLFAILQSKVLLV